MKKNGVMVVECIIASVVVLTAITILYSQIKGVNRSYNKSFNYDNVTSMYALSNFRTFLMNGDNYDKLVTKLNENYNTITDSNDCNKYYIYVDCSYLSNEAINYCDRLLDAMGITTSNSRPRQIIFTKSNLNLNKSCDLKDSSGKLRSTFIDYILTLKADDNDKRYMLIANFDDNTMASLILYRASEVQNG